MLKLSVCSRCRPGGACILGSAAAAAEPAATREATPAPAAKPRPRAKVSRIVFVDQEKCCACTRERIDKSWKALTDVVGFPPSSDVERIHMDSQADKAAPYTSSEPIMVPPALYFYDAQGTLVEVLQGELKPDKLKAAARL